MNKRKRQEPVDSQPGSVREIGMAEELRQKSQMLELLISISTSCINVSLEQIDPTIDNAIAQLGRFVEADRFYIFSYDHQSGLAHNTHEWCAGGIEPEIDNLQYVPMSVYPEMYNSHLSGEMFYVPRVSELDRLNSLRLILEQQNIRSLITVPVMQGGQCLGFIGLDSVRTERSYNGLECQLLTVFAEMVTHLWGRVDTDRRQRENERFLADLVENSDELISIKGVKGDYRLVNRRWEEVAGISRESAMGRTDEMLFPISYARQTRDNDLKVIRDGEALRLEESIHEAGVSRYFFSTKFPVLESGGALTGICTISTELTREKLGQIALETQNQALREISHLQSHILQAPLAKLQGLVGLLEERELDSDPEKRQIRHTISHTVSELEIMIRHLTHKARGLVEE